MNWNEMIEAIDRYREREFGNSQPSCDTDDPHKIPIAYTTVDDNNEHETQVYADVIGLAIEYQVDGKTIQIDKFETPETMFRFLEDMTFDDLVEPGFHMWEAMEGE